MEQKQKIKQGIVIALSISVVLFMLGNFPLFSNIFYKYEMIFYDIAMDLNWKLKTDNQRRQIDEVVIVDIDARSVSKLGKFSYWPRTYWASLISDLSQAGVKAIGMDIIFDRDIRHPGEDQVFLESIKKAGNVFTAIYIAPADSDRFLYTMDSPPKGFPSNAGFLADERFIKFPQNERLEPDFGELAKASKGVGHVGMDPEIDGVLRGIYPFYRFAGRAYPGFSIRILMHLFHSDSVEIKGNQLLFLNDSGKVITKIPLLKNGKYQILFQGPYQTFRYVSFYDVYKKRLDLSYFKDKVVLIGTSLPALFDLRSVPVQQQFPGVEIHANIIYDILHNIHVKMLPAFWKFLALTVLALILGILLMFIRPLQGIIVSIGFLIIYFILMIYIFSKYLYWIPFFSVMLMVFLILIVDFSYKYITEEKSKRLIKDLFSHYVSRNVAEVLLQNPEQVKLGGEKKVCTVLFSDIENFTHISEKMDPEFLVQIINEYHSEMTNLVFSNNGFLDKYEGDAIMAVYGAPVEIGNHALEACKTALEMQARLKELHMKWKKENKPLLKCRIGINTGTMIVGNMGSKERFDYTVMGDSVNLGARLESANKSYGSRILIGETTYQMAKDEILARKLDLIQVKGKGQPVLVYQLLGLKEDATKEILAKIQLFEKGFDFYLQKEWNKALLYFRKILELDAMDFQAKIFIQRCMYFNEHPPAEDWNGVYILSHK
jgi:adenylate cyclase